MCTTYRALLQSQTSTLDDRLVEPYGVRAAGWFSLSGCQPNRVQLSHRTMCLADLHDFGGSNPCYPLPLCVRTGGEPSGSSPMQERKISLRVSRTGEGALRCDDEIRLRLADTLPPSSPR